MRKLNKLSVEEQALLKKLMQGVKPLQKNKVEPPHNHSQHTNPLHSHIHPTTIPAIHSKKIHFYRTLSSNPPEPLIKKMTKEYSNYHKTSPNFYHPTVPHTLRKQMRQGLLPIGASLDLHHHTLIQAQKSVPAFLWDCHRRQIELSLIIHGKGKILKHWLLSCLPSVAIVLAFCEACPHHGASGALYVLLQTIFLEEKYS